MPLATSKAEALSSLKDSYNKLELEICDISPDIERIKKIEGDVCVCDLIAYQIGWGELLLSWENSEQKSKTVYMPAKGYKWNELTPLANSFYDKYSDQDLVWLRKKFKRTVLKIEKFILTLSDDELLVPRMRSWTGDKWSIMKWIQVNTIAPYKSARTKVRRFKKLF